MAIGDRRPEGTVHEWIFIIAGLEWLPQVSQQRADMKNQVSACARRERARLDGNAGATEEPTI